MGTIKSFLMIANDSSLIGNLDVKSGRDTSGHEGTAIPFVLGGKLGDFERISLTLFGRKHAVIILDLDRYHGV